MKASFLPGAAALLGCVLLLHGAVLFGDGVRLALDQRMYPPWRSTATKGESIPDPVTGTYNRFSTDSNFWYEGQILLARREIAGGAYPSWDPWTQAGTPLAAQLGVPPWYPPFWILLLSRDPLPWVGWLAAFHMLLAGIFAWRLLRFLGGSPWAAFLAAAAFGIGPWMALRENNMTLLAAAAWTPLAFEAAGRLAVRSSPGKWIPILAAALALGLSSGMPQLGFVSLWGASAFALWGLRSSRAPAGRTRVLLLGGAVLAGLLLAAPALLPTWRLFGRSIRSGVPRTAPPLKLPAGALPGLLAPDLLGSASNLAGWKRYQEFPPARKLLTGDPQDNPVENCLYPGAPVLLLLLLLGAGGLRNRGDRGSPWGPGFFLVLSGCALLLSMRLPPVGILFRLPGLGPEDPRRVLLLYHLGLAAAAGLSFDRLSRTRLPRRLLVFLLLGPLPVLAAGWVFPWAGRTLLQALFGPLSPGETTRLFHFERTALLLPALSGAWAGGTLLLLSRFRKAAGTLFLAGLAGELLAFGLRSNPAPSMAQVEALGTTRTEAFLHRLSREAGPQGPPRLLHVRCFHALQGNLLTPQGIPVVSTTHPLPLARFARRMMLVEKTLLDPNLPRGIGWLRDPRSALHPLLASARVGLFCCDDPDTAARLRDLGLKRVFPPPGKEDLNEGVALFLSHRVKPRARMVFSWKRVSTPAEAEALLARGKGEVPLESPRPLPPPRLPTRPPRVRWIQARPGSIRLSVDTGGGRGVLLLADSYYPGWQARVDGKTVPLFPADLAFMGIFLEPGTHRVVFSFRDPDRTARILLLAAALGVLAFLLLAAPGKFPGPPGGGARE